MKSRHRLLIHGVEEVLQGEVLHIQEGPVGGVHEQEGGQVAGCVHGEKRESSSYTRWTSRMSL